MRNSAAPEMVAVAEQKWRYYLYVFLEKGRYGALRFHCRRARKGSLTIMFDSWSGALEALIP